LPEPARRAYIERREVVPTASTVKAMNNSTYRFPIFLVLSFLALSFIWMPGCNSPNPVGSDLTPLGGVFRDDTWVATDPIQCLGNPWEQDWLAANNWDYGSYPGDPVTPELEPEELKIITDYYDRQGVRILSAETVQQNNNVCQSCSCPLGYTLYLLVPGDDVRTMLDSGFRLETP